MAKKERYEKVVEDGYDWVWALFLIFILGLNLVAVLLYWQSLDISGFCFIIFCLDCISIAGLFIFAYFVYHEYRIVYWRKI